MSDLERRVLEEIVRRANAQGIDYRTPPFPPGDKLEWTRLGLLQALNALGRGGKRSSDAVIAAAWQSWFEGMESGIELKPITHEAKIGATKYRWTLNPPRVRTAENIKIWLRRNSILKSMLDVFLGGADWERDAALAYVLWNFRDVIVAPKQLKNEKRKILRERFPKRWKNDDEMREAERRAARKLPIS